MNINKYIPILLLSPLLFSSDIFATEKDRETGSGKKMVITLQDGSTRKLKQKPLNSDVYNQAFLIACENAGYTNKDSLKQHTNMLPTMSQETGGIFEEPTENQVASVSVSCEDSSSSHEDNVGAGTAMLKFQAEKAIITPEIKPSTRRSSAPVKLQTKKELKKTVLY
jgi:hypothetical protein